MNITQIEAWALNIIDRVKAGQPIEDSRIELKSGWIDPLKAARRIAGHANAIRGGPILWLIGIDEKSGVIVGAKREDLANWYKQVKVQFDGVSPDLTSINIPVDGTTVVALYFETDRIPFVVLNPSHGKPEGGPVEREVPWREGTATRSATRADLLRLLVPIQGLPEVEILAGELQVDPNSYGDERHNSIIWRLQMMLYVIPADREQVCIPLHKCAGSVRFEGFEHEVSWSNISLRPPHPITTPTFTPFSTDRVPEIIRRRSLTIEGTEREVLINGPGVLELESEARSSGHPEIRRAFATMILAQRPPQIAIKLQPTHTDLAISIHAPFYWAPFEDKPDILRWEYYILTHGTE